MRDGLLASAAALGFDALLSTRAPHQQGGRVLTLHASGGSDVFVASLYTGKARACMAGGLGDRTAASASDTEARRWLWAAKAGGPLDDSAAAVAVDATVGGAVWVAGAFRASAYFGTHAVSLRSRGGSDAFIAKVLLCAAGSVAAAIKPSGQTTQHYDRDLAGA